MGSQTGSIFKRAMEIRWPAGTESNIEAHFQRLSRIGLYRRSEEAAENEHRYRSRPGRPTDFHRSFKDRSGLGPHS